MFSYVFPQNRRFVRGFRRFHHMSQNVTRATEFAPCHHWAQPWQCDSQTNVQHDTSKVLRLPRKMTSEVSKLLRLPKMQRIFWNVANVLRLPHKTNFDTSWKMLKCHKVQRLPRAMKLCNAGKLQKWPLCRTYHRHGHSDLAQTLLRTVANGCGTVAQRLANTDQPPTPPEWNRNPATHSGKRCGKPKGVVMLNQKTTFHHPLRGDPNMLSLSVYAISPWFDGEFCHRMFLPFGFSVAMGWPILCLGHFSRGRSNLLGPLSHNLGWCPGNADIAEIQPERVGMQLWYHQRPGRASACTVTTKDGTTAVLATVVALSLIHWVNLRKSHSTRESICIKLHMCMYMYNYIYK